MELIELLCDEDDKLEFDGEREEDEESMEEAELPWDKDDELEFLEELEGVREELEREEAGEQYIVALISAVLFSVFPSDCG